MSAQVQRYEDFIAAKNVAAPCRGFEPPLPLHAGLFPFQRDAVGWAVRKGCAALFDLLDARASNDTDTEAGLSTAAGG